MFSKRRKLLSILILNEFDIILRRFSLNFTHSILKDFLNHIDYKIKPYSNNFNSLQIFS